MASSMRRIGVVLVTVGLWTALAFWQTGRAQQAVQVKVKAAAPAAPVPVPAKPENGPAVFTDAITLPKNNDAHKLITAAEELLKEEAWGDVARALQSLLDAKEDAFVNVRRKGTDGKEFLKPLSIRAEANRLIGTMPAEGLQFYELQYGPPANARLGEAKSKGDVQILAEVAQRYLHTKAGAEATTLLGTYHLDRRRYLMAALCFERLISRQGADKLPPLTLFKAYLAFSRTDDYQTNAKLVWQQLETKIGRQGLTIGDQTVALDELRRDVERTIGGGESASIRDWPQYRGNNGRSAQGFGGPAFLEARWTASTLPPDDGKGTRKWIEETLLQQSTNHMESRSQPILPALFPIAASDRLLYRSYDGIYARHLKAGSVDDGRGGKINYKPGDIAWIQKSDGSLANMGQELGNRQYLMDNRNGMAWFPTYLNFGPHSIFFDNSVIGTLCSDGQYVYAIDDLSVPPPPQFLQQWGGFNGGQPNLGPFHQIYSHSKLQAFHLINGKLAWELGGRDDRAGIFKDTFFLAPPLPLGGKLYLLTEQNGELRVVCLDPPKHDKDQPIVAWAQPLATARDKLPMDTSRRMHAAHLAYGDGILVCPTNAGAVLGLDLLTRSLVWAHSYRENTPDQTAQPAVPPRLVFNRFGQPMTPMNTNAWKVAAPAIQDGKVVLTAPDGSSIHCLNLRTGDPIWTDKRQNDDLYMAGVFSGRVLVVGKNSCRVLKLSDGKPLWTIANTGTPSGQGVASDNVYYLPIKATAETKEPAIFGIDLVNGEIRSRTISRKKEVPGNLIFHDGDVLSQTINSVTAFPELRVKLEYITARLKENPNDAVGLTERGELRLDKGDLSGAMEDLRSALANNPPVETRAKCRGKLYEVLTDLLQRDFGANEKYLDEYKDLCKLDIPEETPAENRGKLEEEQLRRQSNFLCLLAKGREKQGRLVEAFQACIDFGAVAGSKELVNLIDEPTVKCRPDVWARGRIAAMMARATPEQRQPLEAKIAERWNEIKDASNTEALRQFVALFGSAFVAGRQARLQLAERLIEEGKEEGLRDAQLHLLQLRAQRDNPQLAGQAVEALARLMLRKGLMEHAAYYYRELGRDFAKVVIRDGKTGADFFSDLATDKRFLPYLEDPRVSWIGRIRAEDQTVQTPMQPSFNFEGEGELLPFFHRYRLALDTSQQPPGQFPLKVVDRLTNTEYWRSDGLWKNPNFNPSQLLLNQVNVRHTYHAQGHLAILNLGYMVYAFDPVDKKKLWEYNLHGSEMALGPNTRITPDSNGWQLIFQDGFTQKLGQTGPIHSTYVCLHTRTGLVALDPVRGSVLWTKSDVTPRAQIFGDEQHVYIVDLAADGTPNVTRAVRSQDGANVTVPRFAEAFQNKVHIHGRNLLVRETDAAKNQMVVRLYDVHTGQDLWKKEYPANSMLIRCEDRNLAGVIEPSGVVTVTDLRSRQEVLKSGVSNEHMEKLQDAYLIHDQDLFYLALNKPIDPQLAPWGVPSMNVMNGLRAVPVNGTFYAFRRGTGNVAWYDAVASQMLVLDQFQDLPVVLFTSRYQKPVAQGGNRLGNALQLVAVKSIEKKTGKRVFDRPDMPASVQMFYALNLDPQKRTIELVSFNLKIRHFLDAAVVDDKGSGAGN